MLTSVVIATKDLIKSGRGIERLYWQCLSLKGLDVILVDGSNLPEHRLIKSRLSDFPIRVFHQPQDVLNLPKLWNFGIQQAKEWVHISGADFIYSPAFLQEVSKVRAEDTLVMCKVWELPKMRITPDNVTLWRWPKITEFFPPNPKLANGIQHGTRELFLKIPYDERMERLGGMDNLQQYKCQKEGYKCLWWEQQHVLHQWHKVSNLKRHPQFERNQSLIKDYLS